MEKDIVNKVINEVLTKWAVRWIDIRRSTAAKKLKKASGKAQASFDHSIIKANGAQLAQTLFKFNSYLRYFDMKRINWDRPPPIEEIKEWIEEVGVDKFAGKFRRKYGYLPTRTALINKIAWGISISKYRKLKKRRRKKWYSKSAYMGINALYAQLRTSLSKEALDTLKRELAR